MLKTNNEIQTQDWKKESHIYIEREVPILHSHFFVKQSGEDRLNSHAQKT